MCDHLFHCDLYWKSYYPTIWWGIMILAPSVLQSILPSVFLSVRPRFVRPDEYLQHQWLFFPILYTCIYCNPPMNAVRFCQDQIQNGRFIAIFVCSNWQNILKCCPSGWISPTPINISSWYSTHALTTILPWILWSFVWIKFKEFSDVINLVSHILNKGHRILRVKWFSKITYLINKMFLIRWNRMLSTLPPVCNRQHIYPLIDKISRWYL